MLKFSIEFGELRLPIETFRTYFFGVMPSGATVGIRRLIGVKQEMSYPIVVSDSGRKIHTEYIADRPITLKMVCIHTKIGQKNYYVETEIDLHPDAPEVVVKGLHEFGMFQGKGRVRNTNKDIIVEPVNPCSKDLISKGIVI